MLRCRICFTLLVLSITRIRDCFRDDYLIQFEYVYVIVIFVVNINTSISLEINLIDVSVIEFLVLPMS